MAFPEKKQYLEDAVHFTVIPVFQEIRADFETPLSIYLKVGADILLESIERGENVGRFSIIGLGRKGELRLNDKRLKIKIQDDYGAGLDKETQVKNPLLDVKKYLATLESPSYEGLPPFYGGVIGYLGYETIQYFEDIPVKDSDADIPDGLMIIPEAVLVYDSVKRTVFVVITSFPGSEPENAYKAAVKKIEEITQSLSRPLKAQSAATGKKPVKTTANMTKEQFLEGVAKCKEFICEGEIIQAVLSQQFLVEHDVAPFDIYQMLRILNPSPYLFYLDLGSFSLIGSSPEVMVKVQNRELLIKPIAGTRRRGATLSEDNELAVDLLNDEKERAEHMMLVDLARNDLGRVAVPGSVEVNDFMTIEKYSHVMHIVSTVKAELDEAHDVFDVMAATFPAGTLSGAPKIRAMEIISELEPRRRGPYGGMVFYLGFNKNLDSCITIRTIVNKNGKATVQAGAGIVADSVPENEYQETLNKAQALISAIEFTAAGGDHDITHR